MSNRLNITIHNAIVPGLRSLRKRTRIEKFQANEQNLIVVVVNCLSDRLKIATELIGRLTGKSVDDVKKYLREESKLKMPEGKDE
jgi:hypothetical protein